jgi:acyl carrier protein
MTTMERVQQVVASVLRVPVEKLAPAALLYQVAELDSLTLAEIAAALDDEFHIRLPSDGITNAHSIADLAALVDATVAR